jgi:hypothetical protein
MAMMNNDEQRVDVRMSSLVVSVAPAAVRTLINVMNSLATVQVRPMNGIERVTSACSHQDCRSRDSEPHGIVTGA